MEPSTLNSNEQVSSLPAPPPTEIEIKTSAKKTGLQLATLTLILILITIAGYFFFQNQQLKQKATITPPTPNPTIPSAQPTAADQTLYWQTYTNPKQTFSFRYPPQLFLRENDNLIDATFTNPDQGGNLTGFQINTYQNPQNLKLTDWFEHYLTLGSVINTSVDRKLVTSISLNNISFIKVAPDSAPEDIQSTVYITINGNSAYEIILSNNVNNSQQIEVLSQILSTFKFTSQENTLPAGWRYENTDLCNVAFAVPPKVTDADNRTWTFESGPDQPFGLWEGQSTRLIHRNPEEASGYISGMVSVSCGQIKPEDTTQKLYSDLQKYLVDEKVKNGDSDMIVKIDSSNDTNKWDNNIKEFILSGGMSDGKQKYFLFTKNNNWYLVTSKSDSPSTLINQQTSQILNSLKFNR